ncbi:reverse transcriptase/ribonuclease h/methyltransferase [Elysia marginata]|uniref:Reverse transcriptase/ribonuclease h/methyltransferase n=1 Tax=Elysia marginata TaxID=1093978 RepID=A0AAV4I435_9GAST|nr:reverse transcriptase/ribonuclease h/methyltransferase [Elysia marginata]
MFKSGIDTNVFGAHSIRGAASTAAASDGVPIDKILSTAGWSNASSFARFYHKEVDDVSGLSSVCSVLQAACQDSTSAE